MPATTTESAPVFSFPKLPEQQTYNGVAFPLLISPPDAVPSLSTDPSTVVEYFKTHRGYVLELLQKHSVLFFRGFASSKSTPNDFASFITDGLQLAPFPYSLGNAVRTSIVGDVVFTANEAPPDKLIPFHHELAQTPSFPTRLLFFCAHPATTGGHTPVCLSPAVHDALAARCPRLLAAVRDHGVVYTRVMTRNDRPHSAIGRGWAKTFGASTRKEAEDVLRRRGYSWEWIDDGEDAMLKEISPALPAVVTPQGGRAAFFNQIFAAWHGWRDELNDPREAVRAGNGEPLDQEDLERLKEILEEHEVSVPWERGDFMLIDNMQAMHSRSSFTGKRSVLASLVK